MEKNAARPAGGSPKQQRLNVLFSFGLHWEAADFDSVIPLFSSFRPHIYSPEAAGLLISERQAYSRRLNNVLSKAAKDPFFKRQLLETEYVSGDKGFYAATHDDSRDFTFTEMGFVIDLKPMPIIYTLDVVENGEAAALMKASHEKLNGAKKSFGRGDTKAALRLILDAHIDMVKSSDMREQSVVKNLPVFLDEVSEVFPRLTHLDEVRVLARFGSFHSGIYDMVRRLSEDGQDITTRSVSDNRHSAGVPYSDQLLYDIRKGMGVKEELLRSVLNEIIEE